MKRVAFDIETDGLLDSLTTIHSLVIQDVDSGEVLSCHGKDKIKEGLKVLRDAEVIIGHNIIKFDLPAIKKVYPQWHYKGLVRDTLVLTRLIYSHLADIDAGLIKTGKLPKKLFGSHSLKAWGYRLGELKGDFGDTTDWSEWTPEMQAYCEQDVQVTNALWHKLESKEYSEEAIKLEHDFAFIIQKQEQHGFLFDTAKAASLYGEIVQKRTEIEQKLAEVFGEWWTQDGEEKLPAKTINYKIKTKGDRTAGAKFTPVKHVVFNPASRDHIAEVLKVRYGWEPKEFTETGKPKIDESVLNTLEYPEAKLLSEYFMLNKRAGQLAEGNQGWLKVVKDDGRIHGSVNTNGAVTGRCTHSHPNVAQVPAVGVPYGKDCRSLFTVPSGYRLVGCDAAGLELRCLAHFMARWDNGEYAQIILKGDKDKGTDIHTMNQKAAGLPTRSNAKTFIYGFLYGAGPEKIGSIVGKGKVAGRKLQQRFLDRTPALKNLREAVGKAAKRGYLKGLDGRLLHIRSEHAALNTLLQSAGALVMKKALIILYEDLCAEGLRHGKDYAFVANVHDEYQAEVKEEYVERFAELAKDSIRKAGDHFNFRCPLDGDYGIGTNWAMTH